ncbi:hypothetical protein [Rhodopirellula sp. P2]|uniref:hypothetical protein n=1 Tax=Rhodopirellula sp. P2 TaxID=2127060 RepID=UPI002368D09C|nr:hypothetical protein [Rhodopirellula sp. P2]WDQ19276.1 hypothetical protein PSR62_12270 [Rhodopirellula sp. P2]
MSRLHSRPSLDDGKVQSAQGIVVLFLTILGDEENDLVSAARWSDISGNHGNPN